MPKVHPPLAVAALLLAGGLSLLFGQPIRAAAPTSSPTPVATPATATPDPTVDDDGRSPVAKDLRYRQGEIALGNGLAKVNVPAGFRYLGPEDAEKVLTELWGNPPNREKPLGMILPADVDPDQRGAWAVLVTYEEQGYVKDTDAGSLNYDDLLKKMQQGTHEANTERAKQGYPPIELVGWAAPPRYDKDANKLYWAKELKFGDHPRHTLNYDIRVLGRRGVLVLSAIAGMDRLADMQAAAPQILSMVDFNQGHRYVDFNPKTDKTAAYGLAALIAGGVAAKAGLFKVLLAALLAAKKFVILGVLALGAFVKRLFGGGRSGNPSSPGQGASQ